MSSYDRVEICNLALDVLGQEPIKNFEDTKAYARFCERQYNRYSRWLLSSYAWSFALYTKKLQKLDIEYDKVYGYSYSIPSDSLRVWGISPEIRGLKWQIMNGNLMTFLNTDSDSQYSCVYTKDGLNANSFNEYFVDSLIAILAVPFCVHIVQDRKFSQVLDERARTSILENQSMDARIGNVYKYPDQDPYLDSFIDPDMTEGMPYSPEYNYLLPKQT